MTRTGFSLLGAASGLALTIACVSNAGSPDAATGSASSPPPVSAETLAQGRKIYTATCAPCHGDQGKGDGPASKIFKPPPRDHTDAAYMGTISDDDLVKTIQMGGAIKGKPSMPSNPQIRGNDMTALVAYVRSLSKPAQ
jgi:mono/diheme cytochrome c family protein